ncbi:MAG: hypothetical protein FJX53_13950 [Alphaproteobacteria bacterium]|nr:hypothetical protein [Alphaproteobacteria bacterium]
MKYLPVVAVLLLLAAATWVRYGSLSPCDWMVTDLAEQLGVPEGVAAIKIRTDLALRGITDPKPGECLVEW